jgi:phosphoglycerate kinase
LHAQGINVGNSLIDECFINNCKNILFNIKKNNMDIVLPKDIMISKNKTFSPPYSIVGINNIPNNSYGITIGPQTLNMYQQLVDTAQTILFNGPSGFIEKKQTIRPMVALLSTIGKSSAQRIAIGGDTFTLLNQTQLTNKFDNVSTGGGAALAYICDQPLPALTKLIKND